MSEIIAESSPVYCTCLGSITGEVEALCEKCLDAYAQAILQRLKGSDLKRELERIVGIVTERLSKDSELAALVKADLQAKAAVAEHRRSPN